MVVIQRIKTHWTKKSRGMPNAHKRNQVPKELVLPSDMGETDLLIHEEYADEAREFQLELSLVEWSNDNQFREISFQADGQKIQVMYTYDYYLHGQPNRDEFRKTIFHLNKDEIGSFYINGRFSSYSGQRYTQVCINVANVGSVEKDLFIGAMRKCTVNKMVNLF